MSNFLAQSDLTDVFAGPVQIFSNDADVQTKGEVMTSGTALLVAGTVVARVTATGQLVQWNPAGASGAQLAIGVLVADCNAAAAATPCDIYVAGCFNTAYLGWNGATAIQQASAFDNTKLSHRPLNWSQG
jgi:hypothetical protein